MSSTSAVVITCPSEGFDVTRIGASAVTRHRFADRAHFQMDIHHRVLARALNVMPR